MSLKLQVFKICTNISPRKIFVMIYVNGDLFKGVDNRLQDVSGAQIVIPHVCNNVGKWGAGFTGQLDKKYPPAKEAYLGHLHKDLGSNSYAEVSPQICVVNMITQDGVGTDRRRLKYNTLVHCMTSLVNFSVENYPEILPEIHAPMFGSGLAGGNWKFIEELIEDIWSQFSVFVYHYSLN